MDKIKAYFKGKKVTVLGLGLLGKGLGDVIFLAECGAVVTVTDLKDAKQLAPSVVLLKKYKNVKLALGGHKLSDFEHCDMVIKAQGTPIDSLYIAHARAHNIPIRMDDELFVSLAPKDIKVVGITGTRGKTTTASLMARLFDPTMGTVYLEGKDIRSYEASERAKKIGFILQEPFLFTGTVGENILYGNDEYQEYSSEQLLALLAERELDGLLARFENGLETKVGTSDSISLGQKQLIAFMRAVLRKPDLLILDEATANIDTVTEQLLEEILAKLPKETTKVIIAHRLNTIQNADDIFFVNSGTVIHAGSFDHALEMLMSGKRTS